MNKLLILWTSGDIEVANKMVLLYGGVILPRGYWDEATLMIWGPSAKLLAQDETLQEKVKAMKATGVKLKSCVVCSDEYGVSDTLRSLGIELTHTGEELTYALQNDWKTITL